jgi:hypothetical protein
MRKKVTTAKKSAASVKKTAPRRDRSAQEPMLIQRIVVITTCVVLAVVVALVVNVNKPAVGQSVAGLSIANGLFAQATIDIPQIDGAVSFNIYYKKASDNEYSNAVRNIPAGTQSYTISYLKKGTDYDHKIVAVDASGKEFWFSPSRPILEIQPM